MNFNWIYFLTKNSIGIATDSFFWDGTQVTITASRVMGYLAGPTFKAVAFFSLTLVPGHALTTVVRHTNTRWRIQPQEISNARICRIHTKYCILNRVV